MGCFSKANMGDKTSTLETSISHESYSRAVCYGILQPRSQSWYGKRAFARLLADGEAKEQGKQAAL